VAADFDVVIVGAGVVGLACAARLAAARRSVLVLERHDGICRETSSRNSEVVHAGIYYPPGSRKARTCVAGRRALVERCERHGIDAPRIGKLIVATDPSQLGELNQLKERSVANGLVEPDEALEFLDGPALRRREPDVAGIAALWSPSTGIVDSHRFAASLLAEAHAHGATVAFRSVLDAVEPPSRPGLPYGLLAAGARITARAVVNAAGLGQDPVSRLAGVDVDAAGYRQFPCKGDWFSIAPRHRGRVRSLVYPVGKAHGAGLGVHLTLDTAGGMRLGPDATYVEGPPFDLAVDPGKAAAFLEAGRLLLPFLEEGDVQPELAGIRPKLSPPGGPFRDFVVAEESARGLPGWVTLAGIESPGLTAAMALADEVASLLGERGFL
jgi:L-2-hydroxyglutarate oxidase LhgO